MPPTLKKWGAYWLRLVRPFKARMLKFHIWIPREKIADLYFSSPELKAHT